MWFTLFVISSVVNLIFLFYTRWLLKSIVIINEDVTAVSLMINDFAEHIKGVHELEMFYGDETLASLMKHSKELSEKLENIDLLLGDMPDSEIQTPEADVE